MKIYVLECACQETLDRLSSDLISNGQRVMREVCIDGNPIRDMSHSDICTKIEEIWFAQVRNLVQSSQSSDLYTIRGPYSSCVYRNQNSRERSERWDLTKSKISSIELEFDIVVIDVFIQTPLETTTTEAVNVSSTTTTPAFIKTNKGKRDRDNFIPWWTPSEFRELNLIFQSCPWSIIVRGGGAGGASITSKELLHAIELNNNKNTLPVLH